MVRILIEREDISYEKACDSNVGLWRAIFRKNNELVFVKKKMGIHSWFAHESCLEQKSIFRETGIRTIVSNILSEILL